MRRLRLPRTAAVFLAVLVTVLAVPRLATAASSAHGVAAGARTAVAAHATAASAVTVAAVSTGTGTTSSSGLCSVPGIGDIGGLLGFCSLGSSGLIGDLNNICEPSLPDPEPANGGINAMVAPPAGPKEPSTLYSEYGVAGDYWAATNLQCSDMTSLIGNNVAGMVFDVAKSIDRVTITVYQSAAGDGILSWLQRVTDRLISSLGNAIYFPYLAVVVILGAIWLAWQGLIRKRGTRTIEGTIWMVVACAAAILLIGKPAAVTSLGTGVSDGMSQALNTAFAKLPSPGPSSCVPLQNGDPQAQPSSYNYTSGGTVVDQNADELWTVLVCQPWLDGEFGTSTYATNGAATPVNTYGRSLLWAQAIAVDEKPTSALIQAKQAAYAGIASSIQTNDPALYPLFQGKEWTTRLEIAFAALFAAAVAGLLILLISVTLILLKLGFLLLLIVGPFFLLVGTHPGFGRVLALRWVELLIGVLLKQAAVAIVLSLLLYCYALIMGTSAAVLPWALKILMIALVTVAAFIYRKPFQHLFAAVGYGVIGSHEQAAVDLAVAGATARANTRTAATVAVPPFAAYRAGRWARRNPAQAAGLALAATSGGAGAVAAGVTGAEAGPPGVGPMAADAAGANGSVDTAASRATISARTRAMAGQDGSSAVEAPPLNLPARNGSQAAAGSASNGAPSAAAGSAGGSRQMWPNIRTSQARPAPRRQPAPGQPAPERRSGSSAPPARQPAAGRQPAPPRQAPPPRQSAPPPRQSSAARQSAPRRSWAGRQGAGPARQPQRQVRGTAGPAAGPAERDAESSRWLGEPMPGPLAGTDPGQATSRAVPFWLRARRRS